MANVAICIIIAALCGLLLASSPAQTFFITLIGVVSASAAIASILCSLGDRA